jgi:hypothetical protein
MASQALQAFRRTVTVDWPKQKDVDAKALLIRVAKDGHARIMADAKAKTGAVPDFDAYANSPGRPVESVVLPGPIVYRYRQVRDIVQFTLDALRMASPVVDGEYVRGHTVFVNGVQTDTVPVNLKPGDEIMIANPVVYARRIEIGKTKAGRDFVIQVPNRIYERVAKQQVIPRYRSVAKVTFAYVNLTGAYQTKAGLSPSYRSGGRVRKRRQRAGSAVMSPAIIIEALS